MVRKPCGYCKKETERDSDGDKFDCDACGVVRHAGCDTVRKGDIAARLTSKNLKLYCSKCMTSKLEIANAEKLTIIYKYICKIDEQTQKQNASQTEMIGKIDRINNELDDMKALVGILNERNEKNSNTDTPKQKNNKNEPTYAKILKQSKKPIVIVKPKDKKQKCGDTATAIKTNISYKEVNAHGLRNVSNGGIAIQCNSSNDTIKVKETVQNKLGDEYDVELPVISKPRLRIVRVHDIIDESDLVNEIKSQNDELRHADISVKKVIRRHNKNTPYDVVVELDYSHYVKIIENGQINLGWQKCKVVDHVHLTRCYKCCGFSHISTNCQNSLACAKCGKSHKSTECNENDFKCINCEELNKKFNLKLNTNHHALSYKCDTLKRKVLEFSRRVQYTEGK